MDGRGAGGDSVLVEQVGRSVKCKEFSLKAKKWVGRARQSIATYMTWYNRGRPHSSLADRTPDEAYFAMLPEMRELFVSLARFTTVRNSLLISSASATRCWVNGSRHNWGSPTCIAPPPL